MARSYKRMTDLEWQQVLPLLHRMKETRLQAAYDHLVRGHSLAVAGERAGMTRQNVHDVVTRVLERQLRLAESESALHAGVRRGWLRLTLDVPRPVVKYVQRFAAAVAHGVPVATAVEAHAPKRPKRRKTVKPAALG